MRGRIMHTKLAVVLLLTVFLFYSGCESKTGKSADQKDEVQTEKQAPDISSDGAVQTEDGQMQPPEETKISIPDLKGTWTGIFDKRNTTLNITEQTDSSFSGKITINYRQVINQEVKGSISPSTKKVSMKDQLHSRYQGKYKGKLSDDGENFSGTFTMDLDGKQFTFNLTKK